ncbi:MAG: DegV family protein [Mycoplasmataceae bacterium]|nr:DegV family protein [Mycoplasmataceae bacterium]
MKKLGILLDSFSGLSKKEINKLGFEYISQTTIFDGKTYHDGVDLILKDSIELVKNAKDVKSSMPAIGLVTNKLDVMSKKYENVIYFAMNKGMSSTYSTGAAAASEFQNVTVIANKLVGLAIVEASLKMSEAMNKNGKSLKEALAMMQSISDNSYSYVIPKDVSAVIRSGRLSGVKKVIMEKAKLIPRLKVTEEGFKLDSTKRNFGKMIKSAVQKIVDKIGKSNINKYNWELITTGDKSSDQKVKNAFEESGIKDFKTSWATIGVAAHTGIGAIGIQVWKK